MCVSESLRRMCASSCNSTTRRRSSVQSSAAEGNITTGRATPHVIGVAMCGLANNCAGSFKPTTLARSPFSSFQPFSYNGYARSANHRTSRKPNIKRNTRAAATTIHTSAAQNSTRMISDGLLLAVTDPFPDGDADGDGDAEGETDVEADDVDFASSVCSRCTTLVFGTVCCVCVCGFAGVTIGERNAGNTAKRSGENCFTIGNASTASSARCHTQ